MRNAVLQLRYGGNPVHGGLELRYFVPCVYARPGLRLRTTTMVCSWVQENVVTARREGVRYNHTQPTSV